MTDELEGGSPPIDAHPALVANLAEHDRMTHAVGEPPSITEWERHTIREDQYCDAPDRSRATMGGLTLHLVRRNHIWSGSVYLPIRSGMGPVRLKHDVSDEVRAREAIERLARVLWLGLEMELEMEGQDD